MRMYILHALVVVAQPIKYPDKLQISCEPMLCF